MAQQAVTPQAIASMVFGFIVHSTKVIGLFAVALVAALMALKALGAPITWRTPNFDQSSGIALAALAYVLSK